MVLHVKSNLKLDLKSDCKPNPASSKATVAKRNVLITTTFNSVSTEITREEALEQQANNPIPH